MLAAVEDQDLPAAWEGFISRCNQDIGWNLNDGGVSSIDQVIAGIDSKHGRTKHHADAEMVLKSVVVCVSRLGQLATQAGSIVSNPHLVSRVS